MGSPEGISALIAGCFLHDPRSGLAEILPVPAGQYLGLFHAFGVVVAGRTAGVAELARFPRIGSALGAIHVQGFHVLQFPTGSKSA